jgi:nucleoside triphosphate diphosphatase
MKDFPAQVLNGVSPLLPELTRAVELQQRAARVGFDWNQLMPVLAKIREELAELETEISKKIRLEQHNTLDELGDLLFAVANLARKLGIDPEQALRSTNHKFLRRFGMIETELAKLGKHPEDATLEEMDAIWERAKNGEF